MARNGRRTGGRIPVDALRVHGVDTVFRVPGESRSTARATLTGLRGTAARS